MKSKILRIMQAYMSDVVYNPLNSGMIIGCDCGCGGDSIDDDDYDELSLADDIATKDRDDLVFELGLDEDDLSNLLDAVYDSHEEPIRDCDYYLDNPLEFEQDHLHWSTCDANLTKLLGELL